jgi:hypothetical protein
MFSKTGGLSALLAPVLTLYFLWNGAKNISDLCILCSYFKEVCHDLVFCSVECKAFEG